MRTRTGIPGHAKRPAFLSFGVLAGVLTFCGLAQANGREFFAAPFGRVDLVYTGRVRDIRGRFLPRAEIVIWSDELDLTFPAITDEHGHYRSPDVGANIKEVAGAVDTRGLKAACALPGYTQVGSLIVPRRSHGTVVLNCTLRHSGSAETAAPESSEQPVLASRAYWLVPIALLVAVIGAAVRR